MITANTITYPDDPQTRARLAAEFDKMLEPHRAEVERAYRSLDAVTDDIERLRTSEKARGHG